MHHQHFDSWSSLRTGLHHRTYHKEEFIREMVWNSINFTGFYFLRELNLIRCFERRP